MIPIDLLQQHGFPRGIIQSLHADGIHSLLDPQAEALLRFDLLGNDDLLVALPTSCGKTLIGELAGIGCALAGKRVIFSVPLKALAREKYETLKRRYGGYGLKICLATGEFSHHLEDLRRGHFDIAVLIHEKFKHLLIRWGGFLNGVGLVILDELDGIEEQNRGPVLEFLLAHLKHTTPRVRRIGLLGDIAPDDPLVKDFEGKLLSTNRRPVDLHHGIILGNPTLVRDAVHELGLEIPDINGHFSVVYRSHNHGICHLKTLDRCKTESLEGYEILQVAAQLGRNGEQVLIFFTSRKDAELAATKLAELIPPIYSGLPTHKVYEDLLQDCLSVGIGYHHADLSPRSRYLVEQAFRTGEIRILCCTSTLAKGVNLPTRYVMVHPYQWLKNENGGEITLLPEPAWRNMAGRAGRYGFKEGEGYALLMANNLREWDLYRSIYWTHLPAKLKPHLLDNDIAPFVFSALALGYRNQEAILKLMQGMSSSAQLPVVELELLPNRIDAILDEGLRCNWIEKVVAPVREPVQYHLTGLGEIIALRGISLATAALFQTWIEKMNHTSPGIMGSLLLVCSTKESEDWPWAPDTLPEHRIYWSQQALESLTPEECEALGIHKRVVPLPIQRSARLAIALRYWAEGMNLDHIREEVPRTSAGSLTHCGEGAGWLLETLADLWEAAGYGSEPAVPIRQLAQCVASGLPEWALGWQNIPDEILDRDQKITLAGQIDHPLQLQSDDLSLVQRTLDPLQSDQLMAWLEHHQERSWCLNLLLISKGNHYEIETWHQKILLGMRAAELLLRLVKGRLSTPDGWIAHNQTGIARENISQRMSDLRMRLGPPPPGQKTWIEADHRGHYRLCCPADQILWNKSTLPAELACLLDDR